MRDVRSVRPETKMNLHDSCTDGDRKRVPQDRRSSWKGRESMGVSLKRDESGGRVYGGRDW